MKTFTTTITFSAENAAIIEQHRADQQTALRAYGGQPDAIVTTEDMLNVAILCGIEVFKSGALSK